jgi:hypothetical protein
VWAFRDLLETDLVPNHELEKVRQQATQHLLKAIAYFHRFWPDSYALKHALDYLSDFLQQTNVPVEWAREQINHVANEYHLDFSLVNETIDNRLGV